MLTKETDYAMRLLRTLRDGERYTVAQIAEREMVPQPFAYKILKKLSKAGYVQIMRGAEGGCRLSVDLRRVTLYDLMAAMGEGCYLSGCMDPEYPCLWRKRHGGCAVHCHLAAIQKKLKEELESHSLEEIFQTDS